MKDKGIPATKQAIHNSLQLIGDNGYSGSESTGESAVSAYMYAVRGLISETQAAQRAYRELIRQKLITVEHLGESKYRLSLTPNGAYRLMKENVDALKVAPMNVWDKNGE